MASTDLFDAYFRRADLDGDGQISGAEAVGFFQGSGLPKQVLAQVWTHADQRKAGYLGRQEFYNALKLVTVAQSKRELTPDIVKAALYGPASAKIPAPQINLAATPAPRSATPAPQVAHTAPVASQGTGIRPQFPGNGSTAQQYFPSQQNQFMRPSQAMPSHPQQVLASQGIPRGSTAAAPRAPNPNVSTGWAAGNMGVPTNQSQSGGARPPLTGDGFGGMTSGLMPSVQPRPQATTGQTPSMPSVQPRSQVMPGNTPLMPSVQPRPQAMPGNTPLMPSVQPRPQAMPGNTPLMPSVQPRPQAMPGNTPLMPSVQPRSQATAGQMLSSTPKPQDAALTSNQSAQKDPKISGNGFAADSLFGDVFSATPAQPAQASTVAASSTSSLPVSSSIVPYSDGTQASAKANSVDTLQSTFSQQPVAGPSTGRDNHSVTAQNSAVVPSSAFPVGTGNSASSQSQPPWPKMTHSDVQKYMKVFVQVDTDRDGKITGEQARNLFLSWRLPREVLKQVWNLSDQDNDSMLSLREFCTALYLMERFREGRTLPATLPSSVMSDETLLSATSHPTATHGGGPWVHASGPRQPHTMTGPRPTPGAALRPPRPPSIHHADEKLPPQQKPKIPVLEKHLVDQLSQEEQDSLNSKFQDASQADKKVEELEKEIAESRQKIEFCHAKMQELVLYKSRCDNRLNEIIERVAADKREVEILAKKYEEKYKQTGDVASKLTIEEATFRDIQERKMELYRAIVKMEEGGTADGVLKERVDRIQSSLEELVKHVNERCKQYGLRAKPISLVELPFGWQPGIQGGAADWDEDWDKFEDEGFTFVKELTLDVQNVVAPPKQKSSIQKITADESSVSPSKVDVKSEKSPTSGEQDKESIHDQNENGKAGSPPDSPASRSGTESQPHDFRDSPSREGAGVDGSPHAKEIHSDFGGAEPVRSGEKSGDEPAWGTFDDTHYDSESLWGFDSESGKDADHDRQSESSLFGMPEFRLNPLKTGSSHSDNTYQGMSKSIFADSVPSTPADNLGRSVFADSVPSTPAYNNQGKSTYAFADSVPGTPAYKSSFGFPDSVPSTPAYKSSFGFADSVPSTPGGYSFGLDDHSFDSLSRFDSFNMQDSGSSQSHTFSRFDSMRSTSDQSQGFPSRFDSFRESRDTDQSQGFSRFDSFRDSDQSQGFSRFDSFRDTDNSHGLPSRFDSFRETTDNNSHGFTSAFDSSDHGNAFSRFDSFNANDSGSVQSSSNAFARFDSVRGSRDSDSSQCYSFEDTDPFGSTGPFKTIDGETPRKSTDNWKSF
ncbi:uncharacterized protein [Euphorbia lathyris]|uniref:uncharacterized protein n=1 Tax=Euphorbia lathyris TaxID=212925 RepID=UPI0033132E4D